MQPHHTKDKGDLGVAHAIADLADQGFVVLTALTEHAPFDLVAYRDGRFFRIQVKYRALSSSGTIEVQFRRTWSDASGRHVQAIDKEEIDFICIYCPDTRSCHYIDPKAFRRSVTLRMAPSRNGQSRHVRLASDFRLIPLEASG
jgi:hypothetical protein